MVTIEQSSEIVEQPGELNCYEQPHERLPSSASDQAEDQQSFDDGNDDDDDDISMTPPPHLPVLIVDWQALCGYAPTTREEQDELEHQLVLALTQDEDKEQEQEQEQAPDISYYFEERCIELLETHMAFHGDTSWTNPQQTETETDCRFSMIPYPAYVVTTQQKVISTARAWKRLLQTHPISVVATLLQYLRLCSRSLVWKVDMNREIRRLVEDEAQHAHDEHMANELRIWTTSKRKVQLDTLYQVRETIDQRLDTARQTWQKLDDALQLKVAEEIGLRGLEALDLASTEFAFSNTLTAKKTQYQDEEDEYPSADDESECENSDSQDNQTSESQVDTTTTNTELPPLSTKARAKATIKRQRRKLKVQEFAAKEALHEERLAQALLEEERVREACMTQEYRMAQTVVQSLESRLSQVDDLIETLQEEEWAEEEAGELDDDDNHQQDNDEPSIRNNDDVLFSMLDQILAMILGALPITGDKSQQEHYKWIKFEHTSMVQQWMIHFGRLPPSPLNAPTSPSNSSLITQSQPNFVDASQDECKRQDMEGQGTRLDAVSLRINLGIIENYNYEWDEGYD